MGTIEEKLNALKTTKADLKSAITEAGVEVGDVFSQYPAAVRTIKSAETLIDEHNQADDAHANQFNNVLKATGGGTATFGTSIGSAPYTIEMTEEDEGDLSASQVGYNNVATGMTATDVQSAITELFTSVSEGKSLLAGAITDKGVSTSADDTFQQMAENVAAIESGGIFTSVEINLSGDGTAQVYDCEQKQWISLSSSYVSVKTSNFLILHKGSDSFDSSYIRTDEYPLGSLLTFTAWGSVNYLGISLIDYPEGFSGLTNVKVTLFYSKM